MTHLSPDELRLWFERGQAADRDRVITHLADCDTCRKALSALAMAATTEPETTPALTAADAVPHGYAAHKPARGTGSWFAWLRPAYGLAAAAVIVLAVVWLSRAMNPGDDGIRGSELLAVSPVGTFAAAAFRWESPFEAAKYRITIRDAGGALVGWWEAARSPSPIEPPIMSRLVNGQSYSWQVAAIDSANDIIAESKPVTFTYRP